MERAEDGQNGRKKWADRGKAREKVEGGGKEQEKEKKGK
jgi:hypothetical protein